MTTLSQLKTSVDAWLIRDDVAVTGSDFPQIILIAESEIARNYKFIVQELTTTIQITDRRGDLPANFISLRNPFIDDNIRKFEYKTPQAIREASSWSSGRSAAFFTIEGGGGTAPDDRAQIVIAAEASVSDPTDVEVLYWARFDALVNDPDTNWLLQNHYDVYLYETLRAACGYIQEGELEQKYLCACATKCDCTKTASGTLRYRNKPTATRGALYDAGNGNPVRRMVTRSTGAGQPWRVDCA